MWGYSIFYEYNSVLVFAAAILLFIAFLNLQIRPGRLQRMILAAAPLSFGVYLLHDNPNVRGFVWETLNPSRLAGAWYLVPGVLLLAAAVFAVCALTEWLRKMIAPLPVRLRKKNTASRPGFSERACAALDEKLFVKMRCKP